MVLKYLDVFAESDLYVGITNYTFHEIDTGDVCPLCLMVRRLPYREIRAALE